MHCYRKNGLDRLVQQENTAIDSWHSGPQLLLLIELQQIGHDH